MNKSWKKERNERLITFPIRLQSVKSLKVIGEYYFLREKCPPGKETIQRERERGEREKMRGNEEEEEKSIVLDTKQNREM